MTVLRLKGASGPVRVEVRRAEQDLARLESEVEELREGLREKEESLRVAQERLNSLRANQDPTERTSDAKRQLEKLFKAFKEAPTRKLALSSLRIARDAEVWDSLSLAGLFIVLHEKKYNQKWRGTGIGIEQIQVQLKRLQDRVGEEAAEALRAIFSKKLAWVDQPLSLLMNPDSYERFLVPAIQKQRHEKRHRGEQSEYPAELRSDVCGSKEVFL